MKSLIFSRKIMVMSTLRVPLSYRNRTNIRKTKKINWRVMVVYCTRTVRVLVLVKYLVWVLFANWSTGALEIDTKLSLLATCIITIEFSA
jgi:hypothetical protein